MRSRPGKYFICHAAVTKILWREGKGLRCYKSVYSNCLIWSRHGYLKRSVKPEVTNGSQDVPRDSDADGQHGLSSGGCQNLQQNTVHRDYNKRLDKRERPNRSIINDIYM